MQLGFRAQRGGNGAIIGIQVYEDFQHIADGGIGRNLFARQQHFAAFRVVQIQAVWLFFHNSQVMIASGFGHDGYRAKG